MSHSNLCKPWEHEQTRRRMLGTSAGAALGAMGLGGLAHPALGEFMKRQDKQVLFIWIDGGMSQFESWDPKPGTQFGGPFRSIQTSVPGVHLCELMPQTSTIMHHLAVVRSLCTKDNSHSAGVGRIQRGDPKNRGVVYPYFGSAVAKLMGPGNSGLPPYVWIKPGSGGFKYQDAGFLGAQHGALAFGDGKPPAHLLRHSDVSEKDFKERYELREIISQRYASRRRKQNTEAHSYVFDVAETLMNRKELFDESTVTAQDRERYGDSEFGRHMLLGRKMLEAGVRFVKVNSYGWDTHGDNFNGHASLMPKFDQAFAAMIRDLKDRGMLDNVLVISMSEFGRTPRINGHIGRDHWPESWSLAMAGTGINKGLAIGKTNDKGTFVSTEEFDIGSLFHTWFRALGIDPDETDYDNGGQPLPIAHDEMAAIEEVLT